MSFRVKTIVGVALIEGVLLLILVWSSVDFLRGSINDEIVKRTQTIAESFRSLSRDAVLSTDLARLDSLASQALKSPDMVYVRFMDADHVLLQAGDATALGRPFAADKALDQVEDGVFDLGVDITEYGDVYGRVEIGLSVTRAMARIVDAGNYLVGVAAIEMVLVALFSWVLGAYLTRGLTNLTRATQAVSDGDLGAQVEVNGTDELAEAGRAFNTMSARLADSQRAMQRSIVESETLTQRLHEKELRLSTILNTAVDGIVTIDEHGLIDDINPAGAALFGYRIDELQGRNVSVLMPSPQREQHDQYLRGYLDSGDANIIGVGREVTGLRRDGSSFALDLSVSEMRIEDKRLFVGLVRDISERQRMEQEARRNAALKSAVVEANMDALVTIDLEDRIVEFSLVAEEMFGYRRAEVLGKPMSEVLIPPTTREAHKLGMDHYKETGTGPVLGKRLEVEAMRRSGETFPVELTVQPIEVDEMTLFTAFLRDISERKAVESELHHAKQQAESASEAKSRFVAHMSHEIRSPLNALLGSVDLLLDEQLSEEQRLYVQTAQTSGKALLGLINDILDFSKIEAGELELDNQNFSLRELLSDVTDMTAVLARDKHLHTAVTVDLEIADNLVGDPTRLRQMLVNLVDNALKFTEHGAVVLSVTQHHEDAGGVGLCFTVEDTGIGIAAEARSRLFDEFQQVDSSDSTRHGGSGLGLAICKGLCRAMNGSIGLESEPGRGTRFWIGLRLAKALPTGDGASVNSSPQPVRVVIAGLHGLVRDPITQHLSTAGLHVQSAAEPADALSSMTAATEVVLVDATLPTSALVRLSRRSRELGIERLVLVSPAAALETTHWTSTGQYDEVIVMPLMVNRLLEFLADRPQGTVGTNPSTADDDPQGGSSAFQPANKGSILLAEDSPANQVVAEAMLRRAGYQIDIVSDGRQAVEACTRRRFDAVLMDLRMPEMNGLEATARIRAAESGADRVPIIAMTANARKEDVARCREAGMDDFVAKPVDKLKLLEALERHLQASNRSGLIARDQAHADEAKVVNLQDEMVPLLDKAIIGSLARDTSPESLPAMLEMFLDEIIKRVGRLQERLAELSLDDVEGEAHTVKSCAATFGAMRLHRLAQAMEAACRKGDRGAVEDLGHAMQDILDRTLRVYIERLNTPIEESGQQNDQPSAI